MLRIAALPLIFAVIPGSLRAEITTAQVLADNDGASEIRSICGVAFNNTYLGFVRSNDFLVKIRNEKPLFCVPGNPKITADQLIGTLRAEIKRRPDLAGAGWRDALLLSLVDQYRCP
jgi:hypothetical protein